MWRLIELFQLDNIRLAFYFNIKETTFRRAHNPGVRPLMLVTCLHQPLTPGLVCTTHQNGAICCNGINYTDINLYACMSKFSKYLPCVYVLSKQHIQPVANSTFTGVYIRCSGRPISQRYSEQTYRHVETIFSKHIFINDYLIILKWDWLIIILPCDKCYVNAE